MKNNRGITPIIVAIIIALVLVVGGGSYIAFKKQNPKIVEQSSSNDQIKDNLQTEPLTPLTDSKNVNDENWSTYTNDKFGFKFNYPTSWKLTGEIGESDSSYRPPYLFDEIITTENHPINRAGHISVLSLSLDKVVEETQKSSTIKVQDLTDFKTVNLQGKKFKLVYQQVQGSISQQTDYVYALSLGDKTLFINFTSINTTEKQISSDLLVKIDQFVKTFATK